MSSLVNVACVCAEVKYLLLQEEQLHTLTLREALPIIRRDYGTQAASRDFTRLLARRRMLELPVYSVIFSHEKATRMHQEALQQKSANHRPPQVCLHLD